MNDISETELWKFEALVLQLFKLEQTIHHGLAERAKLERELRLFLPSNQKVEQERRGHLRASCSIPADILCDQGFAPGIVTDLSLGGLFVTTELKLLVGDKMELDLLPEHQPNVTLLGRVAWRKTSKPFGVGLVFEGNPPLQEDKLQKLMIQVMKQLFLAARQGNPNEI